MSRYSLPRMVVIFLLLTACMSSQCAKDNREGKKGGIQVTDFTVTGTTALTSDQLQRITATFIGNCYNDDNEEMGERVRAGFQDQGYMLAELKKLDLKASDPLALVKRVDMEAEVAEGPRFKVAQINFLKNRAFTEERLRKEFPMKKGDFFRRGVVADSFDGIRKLYSTVGYLDMIMIPDTRPGSNATMDLDLTVEEGPQYHMGKLDVAATKEIAVRLETAWKMSEGSAYDKTYIDDFITANRTLLPSGFSRQNVDVGINCPDAQVAVRLMVDPAEDSSHEKPKDVPCPEEDQKSKEDSK